MICSLSLMTHQVCQIIVKGVWPTFCFSGCRDCNFTELVSSHPACHSHLFPHCCTGTTYTTWTLKGFSIGPCHKHHTIIICIAGDSWTKFFLVNFHPSKNFFANRNSNRTCFASLCLKTVITNLLSLLISLFLYSSRVILARTPAQWPLSVKPSVNIKSRIVVNLPCVISIFFPERRKPINLMVFITSLLASNFKICSGFILVLL